MCVSNPDCCHGSLDSLVLLCFLDEWHRVDSGRANREQSAEADNAIETDVGRDVGGANWNLPTRQDLLTLATLIR